MTDFERRVAYPGLSSSYEKRSNDLAKSSDPVFRQQQRSKFLNEGCLMSEARVKAATDYLAKTKMAEQGTLVQDLENGYSKKLIK